MDLVNLTTFYRIHRQTVCGLVFRLNESKCHDGKEEIFPVLPLQIELLRLLGPHVQCNVKSNVFSFNNEVKGYTMGSPEFLCYIEGLYGWKQNPVLNKSLSYERLLMGIVKNVIRLKELPVSIYGWIDLNRKQKKLNLCRFTIQTYVIKCFTFLLPVKETEFVNLLVVFFFLDPFFNLISRMLKKNLKRVTMTFEKFYLLVPRKPPPETPKSWYY